VDTRAGLRLTDAPGARHTRTARASLRR
jgi:hypothetical protein